MSRSFSGVGWAGATVIVALVGGVTGGPAFAPPGQREAFVGASAVAAQAAPGSRMLDPGALMILKTMSDTLARAPSFTFTVTTTREEPGVTGQPLEFFTRASVAVSRSNKLLIRYQGDIVNGSLWYDGRTLTVVDVQNKYYAQTPAPSTIDGALDLMENRFHDPVPAAFILYADPYEWMAKGLRTAFILGTSSIGGVLSQHLAFTEAQADWQVWVQGGTQLPVRLSVRYRNVLRVGNLRVASDFANWNLRAGIPDAAYRFVPPAGARQIPWVPR